MVTFAEKIMKPPGGPHTDSYCYKPSDMGPGGKPGEDTASGSDQGIDR